MGDTLAEALLNALADKLPEHVVETPSERVGLLVQRVLGTEAEAEGET